MNSNYNIERYDLSKDNSLIAWSAADEYLLQAINELEINPSHVGIYNDRFGFLACHLNSLNATIILNNRSQEKAIHANLGTNNISLPNFTNPLSSFKKKLDFALIKMPKSLGLFQLFLEQITHNSTDGVKVICSFMTRHFTPNLLEIAKEYFEVVEQSKALKKARLLILTKKKKTIKKELITSVEYKGQEYKQYLGVFSSDHIDYATQFLLEHIQTGEADKTILDLGSGNGIIGNEIFKKRSGAEIHLMDDSYLAVASAELNVLGKNIHHHYNNELSIFEKNIFDLIVTNPPFHIEYEINIQIPIKLFEECYKVLKTGGNLQVVANKHLNYKVHLQPIFNSVQIIADNEKYIVYKCVK